MPDYSLPAFLNRPTDTAAPLMRGLALGAQIAQERNRLEMQAQTEAIANQVRAEEAQRRSIYEQQQLAMEKARLESEQGLRRQALAQAQQKIDIDVQQMARQHAASERYRQLVAAGADPAKALLDVGPDLGISMVGAAQLYKATQPQPALPPAEVAEFEGKKFLKVPQRGGAFRYQALPSATEGGPIQAQAVLDPLSHQPIPGLVGVPTATGGYTTHNVPDRTLRLAQQRLAAIERDSEFAPLLEAGIDPIQRKGETKDRYQKRLEAFRATKKQYDAAKRIVEGSLEEATGGAETRRGTVPPYPDGTILRKKDGSQWIVQGGVPVPYQPQAGPSSPPHDQPGDEEEDSY